MYAIYRERARSAVLVTVMFNREAARTQADQLTDQNGGSYAVAEVNGGPVPATLHWGSGQEAPVLYRSGDWDSRSRWQPT